MDTNKRKHVLIVFSLSKETYVEHAYVHYICIVPVYVRFLYEGETGCSVTVSSTMQHEIQNV